MKQCRKDTVLLVNGIPLVIAEYKSYVTSGKDWREAVHQLHRYQRHAPSMLTLMCFALRPMKMSFGTVPYCSTMQAKMMSSGISTGGDAG